MDAATIETARWVRRGKRRNAALRTLAETLGPMTATGLAAALDIGMKQASETLRDLSQRRLVRLLDPGRPFKRRYQINGRGAAVARWIDERRRPPSNDVPTAPASAQIE